jgi:uncharacterized protein
MSFENSIPVPPASAPAPVVMSTSDKALTILSHLSVFLAVPFILPFIVWLVKKNDPDPVAAHAAEALNFHLSWLIYSLLCIPLILLFGLGLLLLWAIGLASVILAVIAAIKAADGILFRYPITIRMIG